MKIVKEDIDNLERYIGNSKVGVHAELPLIMADAYEESKKKKEEIDKEMEEKTKDNVKLNKVIGAKKQPVPELPKQLKANLEESLFEDYDSDSDVRHYSNMLIDMIEDGYVDAEYIATALIKWCSEDDIERFMQVNDLISDDEDDDIDESLFEGRGPNKNKPKEDTDLFSLINQELVWENPNFISMTKFPNVKPKQRYSYSDVGIDYKKDGFIDITVRQPSKDKLDFAKKVADAYNAEIIGPASDGNNYILSIRIPD